MVNLCAVYDRKTDTFGTQSLMVFENDDVARRAVHAVVLDVSTEYSRYAADFSLWHVADYDAGLGIVKGIERRKVCEFDEFLPAAKE